jgi:hypothetical protein
MIHDHIIPGIFSLAKESLEDELELGFEVLIEEAVEDRIGTS